MARLVPTNDAERNVLTYRSYEEPLGKAFKRYSDMTARGMMSKIGNVLSAAGYDGTNGLTVMNRQADPSTVRELEEIIHRAPEREQRRMMSKLYGDVGNGSLTVRKAIRDITEFGKYEHTLDLYKAGKKVLRDVATEGILRGEFMVQKQVGVAWKMDVPGTKAVDAFLKGKWAYNDVASYLQPMSRIVRDEMAKGLLLGESPQKLANRWKNVEQINDVRAARNARTTVTAVANQAHADAYKRHGVKRFEFVATFDERTCIDCGKLDGKTFPIDSKIVGSNYPPIHPNCRCTTVAALSKELKEELYQNFKENGTGEEIDPRTTFEEWQKGQQSMSTPAPPSKKEEPKKEKTNPKGESITKQISGFDQISKANKEKAIEQMEQAPEVLQNAFKANADGLKIATVNETEGHGFYDPKTHDVHINESKAAEKKAPWMNPETGKYEVVPLYPQNGTLYHELGHNMNHEYSRKTGGTQYGTASTYFKSSKYGEWVEQAGKDGKTEKVWMGHSLDDMIKIEVKEYTDKRLKELKAAAEDPKSVYKYDAERSIEKELNEKPPVINGDIQDMFNGASKGRISPMMGHPKSYWSKSGIVGDEAFAEMTSATMTNPESLEQIKKYFPRSYEIYLESLEAMK